MTLGTYDPTRVALRPGFEIIVLPGTPSLDAVIEQMQRKSLPWPVTIHRRDRPRRRRHARGGLRRMVRGHRNLVVHETTLEGGADKPLQIRMRCSPAEPQRVVMISEDPYTARPSSR